MTTIQILAIQSPTSRKHEHVRVFGYRIVDAARRVVEVAMSVADATDLILDAARDGAFPEIEVDDNRWAGCLNTGDIEMIHLKEEGPA